MKIKIFQHPAIYVVEDLVNNYLSDIKNEDIVNIQLVVDAEREGYVMIVTK